MGNRSQISICFCAVRSEPLMPPFRINLYRLTENAVRLHGSAALSVFYYSSIITKTRLFKYIESFTSKKLIKIQIKNSDVFHTSAQNIDCGYSLEPPRWGEYPQSMFWEEIRKIMSSVAQLDAPSDWRPGGRVSNPRRGRQHSFVEIDHEIFSTVILSLPLIQEGQLSVSGERMCIILVNRLEDWACPVNVWLGKLTALDMTPLGWLGRKTSIQTSFTL